MTSCSRLPARQTKRKSVTALATGRHAETSGWADRSMRYDSGDGGDSCVLLQWRKGMHAADGTRQRITQSTKPLAMVTEEVRGQKVEEEILLPPGSAQLKILPGGLFSSQALLQTGQFHYLAWDRRQPYRIWSTSSLAPTQTATVRGTSTASITERTAAKALHSLTKANSLQGSPYRSSSSAVRYSTLPAAMGLQIGASYFYMAINGAKPFEFSSARYHYQYVYTFDQVCLTICSQATTEPSDLVQDASGLEDDALYLQKATFGRRLYVIMETDHDLMQSPGELNGSLEWVVIAAKLQRPTLAANVGDSIRLRLLTQSGREWLITDPTQLQPAIHAYFQSVCTGEDLLPLAYNVTDLSGAPVCLLAEACLDGHQLLGRTPALLHPEDRQTA